MGERVKELRCMYGVAESIRKRATIEEVFRDVVQLIPDGWQYPHITRGQIFFDGEPFRVETFDRTPWVQSAELFINGQCRGAVEVFYLERRPELDEGPFLQEERNLINGIARTLSENIERTEVKRALSDSEQRYRSLFERSNDAIIIHDLMGDILEVNSKACQLLGHKAERLTTMTLWMIHPEAELSRVKLSSQKILEKGHILYESRFVGPHERMIDVEISSSLIDREKGLVQAIVRDITGSIRAQEEMKRRLMRFRLEGGNIYLVKETRPHLSVQAFRDVLNIGYQGLVISRTPERELKPLIGECEYWWMAEKGGSDGMAPDLGFLEQEIDDWPKKSAIYIERLDYLVSRNSFPEVLSFIQHLKEYAYLAGHIIIISLDPGTQLPLELRLLEKEAHEVEPRVKGKLSAVLLDLVRHVHRQNSMGVKPSYTELSRELGASRPTIRKRIRHLVYLDYIREEQKGKSKNVELTEKGLALFNS